MEVDENVEKHLAKVAGLLVEIEGFQLANKSSKKRVYMRILQNEELNLASGGDSWAGTPEGRAPYVSPFTQCMVDSVGWSQANAVIAGLYCGGKKVLQMLSSDNP
ncbi:hypothetical protein [Paucibacter sp. KCTC 42545]|uniref:hypothetical protein n=1 Tax=Paucibacter sp. KCTC 42545 TaxID=1768242 RepID=UPI0012E3F0F7|nr:hypothetical protein [Paucibacter sp. KCTC 42545]